MDYSIFNHGGNINEAIELCKLTRDEIIDFSANINPLGIPSSVEVIIRNTLDDILHYPDPKYKKLKAAIVEYLTNEELHCNDDSSVSNNRKINEDNIIVGNGSTELIYLIANTLRPESALLLSPTFTEYERALTNIGSRIEYVELNEENGFDIPINKIVDRADNFSIIFICNPNNPTSRILHRDKLIYLVDYMKSCCSMIVLDEAFIDLCIRESLVDIAASIDNLFIFRSFTKFFSIPGIRLGYGVGSSSLIKRLQRFQEPWSVNVFADNLGISLLRDREFITNSRNMMIREKDFLYERLIKINGLKPFYPDANFVLIKIESRITSQQVKEQMLNRGIFIRDCSNFRGLNDSFIRIAVRDRTANQRLIEELSSIIAET
ncbi:MAG: threonine-phosphate decarboxylase CobD [Spirochaetota bacterium]|nr:threonine-phosphate decarboxylase CobD [Spirochaetota bacterium]